MHYKGAVVDASKIEVTGPPPGAPGEFAQPPAFDLGQPSKIDP